MALASITVRKRKDGNLGPGKTFNSEAQAIETTRVIYATPSLCRTDNGIDTNVKSHILVAGTTADQSSVVHFWVTQDIATIVALT